MHTVIIRILEAASRRRPGRVSGVAAAGAIAFLLLALLPATAGAAPKPPPSPPLAWSGTSDFGTIALGTTASQQFTLTNTGNKPSGAITTALFGESGPSFSITGDGCFGVSLGKGNSCQVTVQYAPANAGQSDVATLGASSMKAGGASINLTGASTAACMGVPVAVLDPSQGDVSATNPTFNGSNSYDPCGRPLLYLWDCSQTIGGQSQCDMMNSDPTKSSWTLTTSLGDVITLGLIVYVYDPSDPNAGSDGYVVSAEDGPFQYNCVVTG